MIAISLDKILENVYAYSSLHRILRETQRPALLTERNAAAIKRIIILSAGQALLRIAPAVQSSTIDGTDPATDDIVGFELRLEPEQEGPARAALESAVTFITLATLYATADTEYAATQSTRAGDALESINLMLPLKYKPRRKPAA